MKPPTVKDELEDGEEGDDKILDVVVVADKIGCAWCLERHLCVCSIALQNELGWMKVLQIQTCTLSNDEVGVKEVPDFQRGCR